jgi:hypothetical protein
MFGLLLASLLAAPAPKVESADTRATWVVCTGVSVDDLQPPRL